MRNDILDDKRLRVRGKKRPHWGILTLDDLPKTNGKYSRLVALLQARYQADKAQGKDKPNPAES
jgi:hypothetical protein